MDDEDILVHLPKMVRFIERGLYGDDAFIEEGLAASNRAAAGEAGPRPVGVDSITSAPLRKGDGQNTPERPAARSRASLEPTGAVFVHCAMGKSRSVTAIVAYLLWKHPHRFGRSDPTTTATDAVGRALKWVQRSRPIAEPNPDS